MRVATLAVVLIPIIDIDLRITRGCEVSALSLSRIYIYNLTTIPKVLIATNCVSALSICSVLEKRMLRSLSSHFLGLDLRGFCHRRYLGCASHNRGLEQTEVCNGYCYRYMGYELCILHPKSVRFLAYNREFNHDINIVLVQL